MFSRSLNFTACLLCLAAFTALQSLSAVSSEYMSKEAAYDLLESNQGEKVLGLVKGDREVLLATLELERNQVDAALVWLSSEVVQTNPLAALIKGEAFRRKSFAAASRAGSYAHAVHADIEKLGNAEFTPALQEAGKRLQAFMLLDIIAMVTQEEQASVLTSAVRESVNSALQSWLKDWQSLNHKAYMSHYDVNFRTDKHDYQSWSQYKQRVNRKKTFINIQISDVRMAKGSSVTSETMVVSFRQRYQSSNYNSNDYKELYLLRHDASAPWLILHEGRHVQQGQ